MFADLTRVIHVVPQTVVELCVDQLVLMVSACGMQKRKKAMHMGPEIEQGLFLFSLEHFSCNRNKVHCYGILVSLM